VIGTLVSTLFLFAIAIVNLVVLGSVSSAFLRVRRGEPYVEEDFDLLLGNRGLLARLFRSMRIDGMQNHADRFSKGRPFQCLSRCRTHHRNRRSEMKLRINGNSIRLRLLRFEVSTFAGTWGDELVAATCVTSGHFHPQMEVNQGSVPGDPGPLP
jgi:hypothetical protein